MSGARVVIIGGGIIGACVAWFLRQQGHDGSVTVLERDPSYRFSSTALSCASIRTQFGCAVNVELSLFGASFVKGIRGLAADADIGLVEHGYLVLGGVESLAARRDALAMQQRLGADVGEVAIPAWLSPDGIAIATFGHSNEGWFDAWALLQTVRRAAIGAGVRFVTVEASGIETHGDRVTAVTTSDGQRLPADWCVNAAGALSGGIMDWLNIALPVRPKKRTVFRFKAPLAGADLPMLFDTSGAWMRPEGEGFIAGIQPAADADPDAHGDFEPDHALFESTLWPILAARVPALEQLRLLGAWAGHYEMNLFDHNGVVGPVAGLPNLLLAKGFSGHGVMHAPGIGRGIAEWITSGDWASIDLTPLGHDRIARGEPMPESAIY